MKALKTLLVGALTIGVMSSAAMAKDFVVDQDRYERSQQQQSYNNVQPSAGKYQKGVYSGSSAYTGGLTGRVAVQTDRIGDMDGRAFTVHPIRGANSEFNAHLRYGDTSQSRETRFNHAFNN